MSPPRQVEDYMLQRACEHAAVFDVYLGLQWANVMFMMRDSEGSGDCGNLALFQMAQRIATLLFFLCHATKYVRICTEERYHWAHASEAERLIHQLYVFTKKTRLGKNRLLPLPTRPRRTCVIFTRSEEDAESPRTRVINRLYSPLVRETTANEQQHCGQ
jgi:hypothetical protein